MLEEFPNRSRASCRRFALNIRRDKFRDPRVRRALNYAFDFEEMNKQIFFGQYKRINSYFDGTELASSGLPEGKELEILETVRAEVPPEVFTSPTPIRSAALPKRCANNLREALQLLKEAGYEVRDRKLVDAKTGEPFDDRIARRDPSFERFMLLYKPSLERLGIAVSVRTIDPRNTRTACAPGFRHRRRVLGPITFAGQRAARILGLAGGRQGRLAQYRRHQESGGRQADRAGDLRQGPRRARCGDEGARPRAAVEPLRGAAMTYRQGPHRALGPLRPAAELPKYGQSGFPGDLVVRRRKGRQDRQALLKDILAHGAIHSPACARLGVGALRAVAPRPALARHGGEPNATASPSSAI